MGQVVTPRPQLVPVDPRYPGVREAVGAYLLSALERGGDTDWSALDVYQAALEGRVQLWVCLTGDHVWGALVTCHTVYPRRRVLEILAFGADAHTEEDWQVLLDELKGVAQRQGCSALVGTGRDGWARKLDASRTKTVWEIDL